MAQRFTIFQQLENLFGPEKKKAESKSRYSLGDNEILKTKSKEEYEYKKLEAQQSKYLANMWHRVDNEIYQQSVFYETTRLASYSDFEGMEFFPEIAAALDIFMEESTTQNAEGRIMNIFSESKRVRRILQDLFFNKLDIHTTLPMWARNTCKYGDNMVYLDIDPEKGIRDVKQLPNIEIERREGNFMSKTAAYGNINGNERDMDNDESRVTFYWKNKDYEFNAWQIAHFRLLGDDRRLPYGTSVLEKARRIWKQLLLSEDAMLIYRVTRAPERRIFKIFVGDIDEQDVPAYVQKMANNFKKSPVIDQTTGQIDTKYNQMAQDQDYFIPVRDQGAPSPIETLPGATNLSEIADIEFLQKKLFTALRVPKPFLGYEETNGDGKNLALQDIRFTRTINRIQQALIQELNKIAIIHLYVLGLEDELDNFTITLNNPSTQADMLRTEQLSQKIQVYRDSVADSGNGFGAMSMTRAKREILGMSEEEIRLDLEQQRLEKAAAAEMEQTANIIKKTGIFDRVDSLYGEFGGTEGAEGEAAEGGDTGGDDFGGGGSFGGGGGFGGGFDDAGGEDLGGEDLGGDLETTEEPAAESPVESVKKDVDKLLVEQEVQKRRYENKVKKYKNNYTKRLLESLEKKNVVSVSNIENSKDSLTEDLERMAKSIDDLTEE
jgi:hypothetical protein